MKKLFFIIAALVVSVSLNAKEKNCIFYPEKDAIKNLKIYFDRAGDLYPPSNLHKVNSDMFYYPNRFDKTKNNDIKTALLQEYFSINSGALYAICKDLGISACFNNMQVYLIQQYANQLNQEIKNGKKIVFLIHGFNNFQEEAQSTYCIIKQKLNEKQDLVFVEVYWDGLAYNKKSMSIWSSAQFNAPYAGLGIRKVLNQVNNDGEIIFFTHSLGARVAAQVLFNVDVWKGSNRAVLNNISNIIPTPPQKNITLCMVAPAIPGKNTFDDLDKYVENKTYKNIQKIIVGYNADDSALQKLLLKAPKKFGATSLGVNAGKNEVANTEKTVKNKNSEIQFLEVDLRKDKPLPKEHSMAEYVRAPGFKELIEKTFN